MNKKKTFSDKLWEKTGLSFWQNWISLLFPKKYNWVNFTFIHFDIENGIVCNEFVVEIGLLGFNMRWQLNLDKWVKPTKKHLELEKRLKEIK